MGVHSAQLTEAMSAFMKEGELSTTGGRWLLALNGM